MKKLKRICNQVLNDITLPETIIFICICIVMLIVVNALDMSTTRYRFALLESQLQDQKIANEGYRKMVEHLREQQARQLVEDHLMEAEMIKAKASLMSRQDFQLWLDLERANDKVRQAQADEIMKEAEL